jgi:hypothetical protein
MLSNLLAFQTEVRMPRVMSQEQHENSVRDLPINEGVGKSSQVCPTISPSDKMEAFWICVRQSHSSSQFFLELFPNR